MSWNAQGVQSGQRCSIAGMVYKLASQTDHHGSFAAYEREVVVPWNRTKLWPMWTSRGPGQRPVNSYGLATTPYTSFLFPTNQPYRTGNE